MSIDRWIDEGFGGEARRNYEDALSDGRCQHPTRALSDKARAELEQHEREAVELRKRLLGRTDGT
jgi:hypothetical protein